MIDPGDFAAARARQAARRAQGEMAAREMPAACAGEATHALMKADRAEFLSRATDLRPWPAAGLILGRCTCGSDVAIPAITFAGACLLCGDPACPHPITKSTGGTP